MTYKVGDKVWVKDFVFGGYDRARKGKIIAKFDEYKYVVRVFMYGKYVVCEDELAKRGGKK